jgi:hypothetical protein
MGEGRGRPGRAVRLCTREFAKQQCGAEGQAPDISGPCELEPRTRHMLFRKSGMITPVGDLRTAEAASFEA